MGQDYECGCRTSLGSFYPCPFHERLLEGDWEKMKLLKGHLKKVKAENKRIHDIRYGKKLNKVM